MAPHTYLLTFGTYASWLPGDRRGWHSRSRGAFQPNLLLHTWIERRLPQPPVVLDAAARPIVDAAIREQCAHAGWILHAAHVRTQHVHVVVSGAPSPEHMTGQIKARATLRLRERGLIDATTRPWARHGSICRLQTAAEMERACRYVVDGQGAPLSERG